MQAQSEKQPWGKCSRDAAWVSLPHSEVKIGMVNPLRDRSVGRCPIWRSMRQPHAARPSERTNNNTGWSVCIAWGLKCDIEFREAVGKSLASISGTTGNIYVKKAID